MAYWLCHKESGKHLSKESEEKNKKTALKSYQTNSIYNKRGKYSGKHRFRYKKYHTREDNLPLGKIDLENRKGIRYCLRR